MSLYDLITNKTVAIIGPAGYVENVNLSLSLASVDTIIRPNCQIVNNEIFLPINTTRRCDIVYHSGIPLNSFVKNYNGRNVIIRKRSALSLNTIKIYYENNVKGIIVVQSIANPIIRHRVDILKRKSPIPIYYMMETPQQRFFRTGIKSLIDILNHNPRKLFIYGYDFYSTQNNGFKGYYGGNENGLSPSHNTRKEMKYFIKHILSRPNVMIDSFLSSVVRNFTT